MSSTRKVLPLLCSAMVLFSLVLAAPTGEFGKNLEADLTIEAENVTGTTTTNSSSFSCHNRPIGYYADIQHNCKVYHFCLQGDLDGELVSQRVSYLCLNETLFDQQKLDCVSSSNMTTICADSANYFQESNLMMMEAFNLRAKGSNSS